MKTTPRTLFDIDVSLRLSPADHTYQTDGSYTYDANGNCTMTGYTTGTNSQLTGDDSYEYDDEGNRTERTDATTGEVVEYEWDFRGRRLALLPDDGC